MIGDPEVFPEPTPEPDRQSTPGSLGEHSLTTSRRRLGGGGGGGGDGPRRPSGDPPFQGYLLTLQAPIHRPPPALLGPAISTVQLLGGSLVPPFSAESLAGPEFQALGEALTTLRSADDIRVRRP
jgi:hypothetical protein